MGEIFANYHAVVTMLIFNLYTISLLHCKYIPHMHMYIIQFTAIHVFSNTIKLKFVVKSCNLKMQTYNSIKSCPHQTN